VIQHRGYEGGLDAGVERRPYKEAGWYHWEIRRRLVARPRRARCRRSRAGNEHIAGRDGELGRIKLGPDDAAALITDEGDTSLALKDVHRKSRNGCVKSNRLLIFVAV
jgi:hypothetical protein